MSPKRPSFISRIRTASLHEFQRPEVLVGMADAAAIAILIVAGFVVVDVATLVFPAEYDRLFACLITRILSMGVCTVFYMRSSRFLQKQGWRNNTQGIQQRVLEGVFVYLIVGCAAITLVLLAGGGETYYFAGLMLIFFGIAIMTPWHYSLTVVLLALLLLIYILATVLDPKAGHISIQALVHILFLASALVLSCYGSRVLNRLSGENPRYVDYSPGKQQAVAAPLVVALISSVPLLVTSAVLYVFWQSGAASLSSLRRDLMYPVRINEDTGTGDQSFEFLNTSGQRVLLDRGQIVFNNSNSYDIKVAGPPAYAIGPGGIARIYRNEPKIGYHLGITNDLPFTVTRARMRLFGVRIKID